MAIEPELQSRGRQAVWFAITGAFQAAFSNATSVFQPVALRPGVVWGEHVLMGFSNPGAACDFRDDGHMRAGAAYNHITNVTLSMAGDDVDGLAAAHKAVN